MPRLVMGRVHIGLDIGTNAVRAAEVKGGDRSVTVTRFGQVLLPHSAVVDGEVEDPEVVGEAIATLWKRADFASRDVRVGVANRRVVVRQIEMQAMPKADLEGAIRFEAADYIPIPLHEAVMDFEVIEEYTGSDGEAKVRVLVVAAEREMVDRLLRALSVAKLEPEALELNAYPLVRSLGTEGAVPAEAEAIVDVGAGVTNVVVQQAGKLLFVRILNVGGDDFTQALSTTLALDWEEAESLKHSASHVLADQLGEMDGEDLPEGFGSPEEPPTEQEEPSGDLPDGDDIQRALAILDPQLDRFVDEVRGSLDFYTAQAGSVPLRAVVLSGGGSLIGGLRSRLGSALRSDVEEGHVFAKVNVGKVQMSPEQVAAAEPFLSVAVGLALGALED